MLPIRVSENSREPIYHQIENQIKALIVSGQLLPGTSLPSIRALANDLSCSVITTRRAYQNLETAGFIKTSQGKGTFVNEIDLHRKQVTKHKLAVSAFERAVEQGKQLGCSNDELRSIFAEVLNTHFRKIGE